MKGWITLLQLYTRRSFATLFIFLFNLIKGLLFNYDNSVSFLSFLSLFHGSHFFHQNQRPSFSPFAQWHGFFPFFLIFYFRFFFVVPLKRTCATKIYSLRTIDKLQLSLIGFVTKEGIFCFYVFVYVFVIFFLLSLNQVYTNTQGFHIPTFRKQTTAFWYKKLKLKRHKCESKTQLEILV